MDAVELALSSPSEESVSELSASAGSVVVFYVESIKREPWRRLKEVSFTSQCVGASISLVPSFCAVGASSGSAALAVVILMVCSK
jgi:hypothetical protein